MDATAPCVQEPRAPVHPRQARGAVLELLLSGQWPAVNEQQSVVSGHCAVGRPCHMYSGQRSVGSGQREYFP